MFTSMLLGAALTAPGAPVPPDTVPAPTGPAPQVAYLRADASGQVWVQSFTFQKQKQTRTTTAVENGKQVQKQEEVEVTVPVHSRVQLTDLGAKFATADGAEVSAADAARRVKDGAAVLVSADGKPVQKAWLRAVGPDTLVVTAEKLAGAVVQNAVPQFTATAAPRLVLLAADAEGKLRLAYNPAAGANDGGYYGRAVMVANGPNGAVMIQRAGFGFEADPGPGSGDGPARPTKLLEDVRLEAYDLAGQAVARDEALKRLKAGGLVLVAGDRSIPDPAYLKVFKGELLVLVSAELAGVPNGVGAKPLLPAPAAGAAVAPGGPAPPPVVAVPAVAVPVAPAVAVPALPAKVAPAAVKPVAPAPAPKPVEKKVEEKKPAEPPAKDR